jgi:very-short-patch-repair endonuclease
MNVPVARKLRKQLTDAERRRWSRLRLRQLEGLKFRRQASIGRYVVDFVCFERKLIIEVDGGQHAVATPHDRERTTWLKAEGFRIVRI